MFTRCSVLMVESSIESRTSKGSKVGFQLAPATHLSTSCSAELLRASCIACLSENYYKKHTILHVACQTLASGSRGAPHSAEKIPSQTARVSQLSLKIQKSPMDCFPLMPCPARTLITELNAPDYPDKVRPDPRGDSIRMVTPISGSPGMGDKTNCGGW
jgi:hypothetical protein